jgi:hypothetical protein
VEGLPKGIDFAACDTLGSYALVVHSSAALMCAFDHEVVCLQVAIFIDEPTCIQCVSNASRANDLVGVILGYDGRLAIAFSSLSG